MEYFKKYLTCGRLMNWIEPNPVKNPQEFVNKFKLVLMIFQSYPYKDDKYEFYYNDLELEGVIPHVSGSARTEGYYKISKQKKRLMRRHEHYDQRTIISTQVRSNF